MRVYLVYDDSGCYEGPWLRSIWATKEAAEAEAKRLDVENRWPCHFVEEQEVRE